jgi:hypothetical protein
LILKGVGTGLVYLNIDLPEYYIFLAMQWNLKRCDGKSSEKLLRFERLSLHMGRSFEEWWSTAPLELKQKARKGDEGNKPLLNQNNYVLLHLHLSGKHDLKPTHEELKDWLHSGQVDVMRMEKKK